MKLGAAAARIAFALLCILACAQAAKVHSGWTPGEAAMAPEWLKQALREEGLSFPFYRYDDVAPGDRTPGQAGAIRSSASWHRQLLVPWLHPPSDALIRLHGHSGKEADALSFEFRAIGYRVRALHQLNALVVELTPDAEQVTALRPPEGSAAAVVQRIVARALLQAEGLALVSEREEAGCALGRQKTDPKKPYQERTPLDHLVWWTCGDAITFASYKVSATVDGRWPSTAGYGEQQVQHWFELFGARRVRPDAGTR